MKASFIQRLIKECKTYGAWIIVSAIPWSLCVAGQFYLFSAYLEHSVISYEWSFGQIIAVTIWLPSLVEYIYIEWSRFHPPLHEVRASTKSRRWDHESLKIQISGPFDGDGPTRRIFGCVEHLTACQP